MRALRVPVATMVLALVASGCAGSGSSSSDSAPGTPAASDGQESSIPSAADALDLVVLSDSLARGGWPQSWADLMHDDLGVVVTLHDLSVSGKADYDAVLQQSAVRDALRAADVVFISPDPDYLQEACPPGQPDPDCVTTFSADYRARWAGWLDDIESLSGGALLRSAEAWVWLAPSDRRAGLVEFMHAMAVETVGHGGLVADLNSAVTGPDHTADPPSGWIDATGHLTGPGADAMAELLHDLGYQAQG